MYRYLLPLSLIFSLNAAPPVTHPSNPNYYPYIPDQNTGYQGLSRSDKKIENKVREKLRPWFLRGYEGQINIEVDDGNVSLYGTVQDMRDKDDIEHAVRRIDGVRSINNQLSIRAKSSRPW